MKDAKLNLCNTLIGTFSDHYRARKATLNVLEKVLYETALKIACREMMPSAEAKLVIAKYELELRELQERAEAARVARAEKKNGTAGADGEAVLRTPAN